MTRLRDVSTARASATVWEMERLLLLAAAASALWEVRCRLMMLFASRPPHGLMRQVAEFLPSCVTTARVLRKDLGARSSMLAASRPAMSIASNCR